jgi:chromosome segregation ATPase
MDEMRRRQDTFDMRLTTLEEKVDTEANLRATMNKDISDIKIEQRAQRGLLQAVAITQSEHTARLTAIETDVAVLKTDVAVLKTDVAVLKTDVAVLKTDMAQVKSTLGNVQVGVQTIIAILDRQIDETGGDGATSTA